jgi:predicted 2-oxoglutarate/Fe(II)-dependent dioxygenase YbiX
MWSKYDYYQIYSQVFVSDNCNKLIDHHRQLSTEHSILGAARNSNLYWLNDDVGLASHFFDRVYDKVLDYNQAFNFKITKPTYAQLTKYSPGQYYHWHQDIGAGDLSCRKISVSVQLTAKDPTGGIEIFYGQHNPIVNLEQGDLVVFPAWVTHRATQPTNERWSLVFWVRGTNPFL